MHVIILTLTCDRGGYLRFEKADEAVLDNEDSSVRNVGAALDSSADIVFRFCSSNASTAALAVVACATATIFALISAFN